MIGFQTIILKGRFVGRKGFSDVSQNVPFDLYGKEWQRGCTVEKSYSSEKELGFLEWGCMEDVRDEIKTNIHIWEQWHLIK